MHDTPMKPLFNQRGRAFSAGCVRVQDVFTLAEWVARYEPGWERPGRAQEILAAGNAFDLNLTRPVPVYFAYITAWAEPDGAHPVPPRHLRPRRPARCGGRPRARSERRPRPALDAGALSRKRLGSAIADLAACATADAGRLTHAVTTQPHQERRRA